MSHEMVPHDVMSRVSRENAWHPAKPWDATGLRGAVQEIIPIRAVQEIISRRAKEAFHIANESMVKRTPNFEPYPAELLEE